MESSSIKVTGKEVHEPASASIGKISSSPETDWCFDLACRWKYGLVIFPQKIEKNSLKIALHIMEDVWTP